VRPYNDESDSVHDSHRKTQNLPAPERNSRGLSRSTSWCDDDGVDLPAPASLLFFVLINDAPIVATERSKPQSISHLRTTKEGRSSRSVTVSKINAGKAVLRPHPIVVV